MNAPLDMRARQRAFRALPLSEQLREITGSKNERLFKLDGATANEADRTVWMSIASSKPYERWWGFETLDMRGIRGERLSAGAPILVNHDGSDLVGVIDQWVVSDTNKLRVLARFSASTRGQEVFADVLAGIRRSTSIGYVIHKAVLTEQGKDGAPNSYRVTDWEPMEGSLVSVPADPSVGPGRSFQGKAAMNKSQRREANRGARDRADALLRAAGDDADELRDELADEDSDLTRELDDAADVYERFRVRAIERLAHTWRDQGAEIGELARAAVSTGLSLKSFREEVLTMVDARSKIGGIHTGRLEAGASSYGTMPREDFGSPSALRAFPQTLQGQESAFAAGQYYKAIGLQDKRAMAWCEQRGMFARTMTEGVFTSGGNLAPVAIAGDLVRNVEEFSLARKVCRRWPMSTAALEIPVQTAGVTATFVSEGDATTESAPTSTNITLTAKELACMTTVSRSLIEDSSVAVGDWLTMVFSTAVAQKEEGCLFIGDGSSTYGGMRGAVTKILDASYAGSRFATPSGEDQFSEFTTTSLSGLMALCPENSKSAPGAGWFCSSTFKDSVMTRLALAAGGNDTSSIREGVGARFGGYPIYVTSVMKSDTTEDLTSLCPLLFGNMGRAAAFGDRHGVDIQADSSRYFEFRKVAFQVTTRFSIVVFDIGTTTTAGQVVGFYCG